MPGHTVNRTQMEQNKQAHRQVVGSYLSNVSNLSSNLSNVFLPAGMQGGSRVAYSPVYRPLKKSFIFCWSYLHYVRRYDSRTGFPSQTVSTCDLKSKRKDIFENNRETKSSGNSTLNKPCLWVPNSSVNKSCSIHHCRAREIKERQKAGEEAWREA